MKTKKIYEVVTMKNGLKMLSILPINETGIAEAYTSIKSAEGYSEGSCGTFNPNLYKQYKNEKDFINGIKDFKLGCDAIGVSDRSVITNRLTAFTDKVRCVSASDLSGYDLYNEPNAARFDGLVTDDDKVCLFNYAADCAIAFLVDPIKRVCGSCHASWKGSLIGIFQKEVEAFVNHYNSKLNDIICVVCPSIGKENFEVGTDVAEQFVNAGFENFIDYQTYDNPHIDLPGVNRQILLSCGLVEDNVYIIDDMDTVRDSYYWHSFRRGPIDENNFHLNGQNGYWIRLKKNIK